MIYIPNVEILRSEKMRSTDRILTIRQLPGRKPTSGTGLVDPHLFTGGNKLHAIQDPLTSLWSLKYERGIIPPALKMKWTSFSSLLGYVTKYFKGRHLEVVEVID